ncbi:T-cell receptor beta chain T17T-22 [Tupaia chinensis]|nr:T-cell receptor beta chain T17T-22 [Tupaia chinensis]
MPASPPPGAQHLSKDMPAPVLPDSAWGTRILCCAALCLLGAGSVDVGVTQTPRYLITEKRGQASLKCYPIPGHNYVYWYQLARDQGPQFLISFYEKMLREKGIIPDRFSVEQFGDYHSEMNMSSLELGDSASYLCASSVDTALQSHWFSVPKPSCPS